MKKIFMFIILSFFISITNLKASCNDSQMLADFMDYSQLEYFTLDEVISSITFYNMDDSLYLEVTNDYNDDVDTYNISNFIDGELTIYSKTVVEKINYSVKVYTTDSTCPNKVLRNIKFTTSKYNPYIYHEVCSGRYDTNKYCDAFYDVSDLTLEEYIDLVNEEIDKTEVEYSFMDYVKMYYLYVLVPFLLISIIYIIRIIIVKRRKKQYV